MSVADLGKYDVSEQTQALKEKLSSQDTENAGLRSQLMKREAELEGIKISLNETLHKLSVEADRALRLETDLSRRSDELKSERIASHNTEAALAAAQEKLRAEERAAKDLEATLETLARNSDSTHVQQSKLEREKRNLEARVRELETNLHHLSAQPAPAPQIPRRGGRPRSSSASNFRIPALEQELNDVKASSVQKSQELRIAQDKLARLQTSFTLAENTRMAADKAAQSRIGELVAALEEKEEELLEMKASQGDGCTRDREEELMNRIEEDEAKISALETLLRQSTGPTQVEFNKLTNRLRMEIEKVSIAEACRMELLQAKQEALEERDTIQRELSRVTSLLRDSEAQIKVLSTRESQQSASRVAGLGIADPAVGDIELAASCLNVNTNILSPSYSTSPPAPALVQPPHPDESTVAGYIETLLSAVDRLRGERADLKRALDFLETESRITVDGLREELAAVRRHSTEMIAEDPKGSLREQLAEMSAHHNLLIDAKVQQNKHLSLASTAFAITISHLQTRLLALEDQLVEVAAHWTTAKASSDDSCHLVQDCNRSLESSSSQVEDLQSRLDAAAQDLAQSEQRRGELLVLVTNLESDVCALQREAEVGTTARRETHEALKRAEAQIAEMYKSHQDIESQRNSLNLQVTNLQAELSNAEDALNEAQCQISNLQTQQLSSLSTTEVTLALRGQIEELEDRVARRTEQIGIHQHDIRRLETNLKLQEERIAEMTTELDLLGAQKEAMVEDCAEAREARDRAIRGQESAELEAERIEEQMGVLMQESQMELTTMVKLVFEAVSRSRQTTTRLQQLSFRNIDEVQDPSKIATLETMNAQLLEASARLDAEKQHLNERLEVTISSLKDTETLAHERAVRNQELTVSLAVVRLALGESAREVGASHVAIASFRAELLLLREELERRVVDIQAREERINALQKEVSAISVEFEADSAIKAEQHQAMVRELEEQLRERELRYNEDVEKMALERGKLERLLEAAPHAAGTEHEDELSCLRLQHAKEIDDLQAQLALTDQDLIDAKRRCEEAVLRLSQVEEETTQSNTDLHHRLADLETELARAHIDHAKEHNLLQNELVATRAELLDIQQSRARLEDLYHDVQTELLQVKHEKDKYLTESIDQARLVNEQHQKDVRALEAKFMAESDGLHSRCEESARELQELHLRLQEEVDARGEEQEEFRTQLEAHTNHIARLDLLQLELHQTLSDTRTQLEQTEAELLSLQGEKRSLQTDITTLEAEIQRLMSLIRYLESQVKESEATRSSLKDALEEARMNLAQSEKSGKAAEINLALQGAQHEQILSVLRRELASLQSQPNLQDALIDLEERNREMDELLKSKCAEIEDYDDKILESLKVNKKLATKVEVLTRKVQTLQTKLSSMKGSTQASPSGGAAFGKVPASSPDCIPPIPPIPATAQSQRVVQDRTISGPSTLPRPKTPDRKMSPPTVFHMRTPEKREATEPASTSAGKKRRAPDDDERDGVPPEGHYHVTDSVADHATTPRLRKAMHANQIGFTPVRNLSARTILGLPSPGRRITTALPGPQVISDVTNSPRSTSSQANTHTSTSKRSWLGKIRGGVPQAAHTTTRPWSARPNLTERLAEDRL
ncbi:hypothetical protein BV22DRAFT_1053449 [Leucogyrophana mollusca]|uniref:Uncharacterized protein n=1 Tax=Leucogyrophana mollusca TaxID=85980 RepID=A0ACB8BYZ1_9AGAM|nr:hypothetical protein BV22DRAFT_1053449 [Leucogyrophana mollusca]